MNTRDLAMMSYDLEECIAKLQSHFGTDDRQPQSIRKVIDNAQRYSRVIRTELAYKAKEGLKVPLAGD